MLTPGNDRGSRQIQWNNQIKFGSGSFWSIEHECVQNFNSKQFSCLDKPQGGGGGAHVKIFDRDARSIFWV